MSKFVVALRQTIQVPPQEFAVVVEAENAEAAVTQARERATDTGFFGDENVKLDVLATYQLPTEE